MTFYTRINVLFCTFLYLFGIWSLAVSNSMLCSRSSVVLRHYETNTSVLLLVASNEWLSDYDTDAILC